MILTKEQRTILYQCVGGGPIHEAKIVVFGNELGTSEGGGSTERTIDKFIADWRSHPVLRLGRGFAPLHIGELPVNSVFLQCVSRLALALRHNEPRFFDPLSGQGQAVLNRYILDELYRTETAVINLRPLPRSTERHWDYDNVNERGYLSQFNFTLLRAQDDPWRHLRVSILKTAFDMAQNALILGAGDRHNKRAFFETIYPEIRFKSVDLSDKIHIYVAEKPRIVLSNYYSPYTGLGLDGMKVLYEFLSDSKLV